MRPYVPMVTDSTGIADNGAASISADAISCEIVARECEGIPHKILIVESPTPTHII